MAWKSLTTINEFLVVVIAGCSTQLAKLLERIDSQSLLSLFFPRDFSSLSPPLPSRASRCNHDGREGGARREEDGGVNQFDLEGCGGGGSQEKEGEQR